MRDEEFASTLRHVGNRIEVRELNLDGIRSGCLRRFWRRRAAMAGILLGVGAAIIATVVGVSGSSHQASHNGTASNRVLGPGCGAQVSVDPAGGSNASTIHAPAAASFQITATLTYDTYSVSSVDAVELIVGTQDSINGLFDPSSAPSDSIQRPENQLSTQSFGPPLAVGATLTLTGTGLPAGTYPVYGLVTFVNSANCGGHTGQEINQLATLTVA